MHIMADPCFRRDSGFWIGRGHSPIIAPFTGARGWRCVVQVNRRARCTEFVADNPIRRSAQDRGAHRITPARPPGSAGALGHAWHYTGKMGCYRPSS